MILVPLSVAKYFAAENAEWVTSINPIFNVQISLLDVIIEALLAVAIALFVLFLERTSRKRQVKKTLEHVRDRLRSQQNALSRAGLANFNLINTLQLTLRGMMEYQCKFLNITGLKDLRSLDIESSLQEKVCSKI